MRADSLLRRVAAALAGRSDCLPSSSARGIRADSPSGRLIGALARAPINSHDSQVALAAPAATVTRRARGTLRRSGQQQGSIPVAAGTPALRTAIDRWTELDNLAWVYPAIREGHFRPRTPLAFIVAVTVTTASVITALGGYALASVAAGAGTAPFAIALPLALLPVPLLIAFVLWMDRLDPRPRGNLAFAFGWGAGVAAVTALIVNTTNLG